MPSFAFLFSVNKVSIAVLCGAFFLASCAQTRLVLHATKKLANKPEATTGTYKVGKPYRIGRVWYHPKVDYSYKETGMASWYGAKFHNRRTANGQIFDMNAISAAHRTLPLPSVVQVTNLKNGRSLKVLVNDRGPFAHDRIIDLSRRAAQLLGFERAGIVRVRVEIILEESRRVAVIAGAKFKNIAHASQPRPSIKVADLPATQQITLRKLPVSGKTRLFVQAGSYVRRDLAKQTEKQLAPIGPTQIVEATIGKRLFYRVRLGPMSTVNDADRILDAVVRTGYPDARLVVY